MATAITSLDVVDIARSCRTYGVRRYYIVHPVGSQRVIAERILEFWRERGGARLEAVEIAAVRAELEECLEEVKALEGREPLVLGTSARKGLPYPRVGWEEARGLLKGNPILLLFGTGNGMAEELLSACDALLPPIREGSDYNHLSVRAAVAIVLDRLKGEEDGI